MDEIKKDDLQEILLSFQNDNFAVFVSKLKALAL